MAWRNILIYVALLLCNFAEFGVVALSNPYLFSTKPGSQFSIAPCKQAASPKGAAYWSEHRDSSLRATQSSDELFDAKTAFSLVGGQSSLIAFAAALAAVLGTPNLGLGPGIDISSPSLAQGALMALPLGLLAYVLDFIEDSVPALHDVTKATQRSVLALLGGTFKPFIGLAIATALGIAAGVGEEMLFRGVLQYEIGVRCGDILAVVLASVVFGALHAVTPLYAFLASLASIYFGYLYLSSGNLAVPISTHTVYDIVALYYAHWTVSQMSENDKAELLDWQGPIDSQDT